MADQRQAAPAAPQSSALPGPRAQRTIASILYATRQIFPRKGYAGTSIDEIARTAGVSRPTVYAHFASKRDIFLALGEEGLQGSRELITSLNSLRRPPRLADIIDWVSMYLQHLDRYGSFAFAWIQAAHEDDNLRQAGMTGHLDLCRKLGEAVAQLGGREVDDPTSLGLAIDSLMEHAWAFSDLYGDGLDRSSLVKTIANVVASTAVGAPDRALYDARPAVNRPVGHQASTAR